MTTKSTRPERDISYRTYLQQEFNSRCQRNPNYSLRAFARDLDMWPSKLSEVLNEKCGISSGTAKTLSKRLRLSPDESAHFMALVESEHSRSPARKRAAIEKVKVVGAALGFSELDLERFKVISDWIHFAILELCDVVDFQSNEKWIATRLGVSAGEVKEAVARLRTFGLLATDSNGRWVQTTTDLAAPEFFPSREKRNHHAQILNKSMAAIDRFASHERDFSSMTMAIASEQMEEARTAIRTFRRSFTRRFQANKNKDRVFSLAIQFFPLDDKPRKSKEIK